VRADADEDVTDVDASATTACPPLRFSEAQAVLAQGAWGFNCGPAAVCAAVGLAPHELRPHLGAFEGCRYMNPTMVYETLDRLRVGYTVLYRSLKPGACWPVCRRSLKPGACWPVCRLAVVRVQFGGPWCGDGVDARAAYRYTHWVATHYGGGAWKVFDVNCMDKGGWVAADRWRSWAKAVLAKDVSPRADGTLWPTHAIRIDGTTTTGGKTNE
jgi:hypothetical protein